MHVKLMRHFGRTNEWKLFLINVHEDFCGYMNGTSKTAVLSLILPTIFKHSNLNQKCPISVSYCSITLFLNNCNSALMLQTG